MITLQIVDGSLQVSNNGSIILVAPKNSCAIDVLSLYDAIPLAVIYNKYLGTSTNIFTQPLANCENSVGTPFSVNSFIAFAEANLGFDTVGGGCGGSSPFEYNANLTGIQPILGTNDASGVNSTIGGGSYNTASNLYATIGGGGGSYSLVGNIACGIGSTVSGGLNNKSLADYSTTSGGKSNIACGQSSMIGGGQGNNASNTYATINGGLNNTASGTCSFIGGGVGNIANANFGSLVSGGFFNTASNLASTIGGGYCNVASGNTSTVSGGYFNLSSGTYSFIGGGHSNTASGTHSFIGGGDCNTVSNCKSIIGGGYCNINNGSYSGILGGKCNNTNNYSCSMIVGNNITANRSNTAFVNDLTVCSMSACSGCSVKVSTNGLLITNNLSGGLHTFLKPAVGQSTNVSLNGTAISTIVGVVNKLTVSPFIPAQTITSASLYINVTVSGIGSNARILIYSNLNGKPDIKLYESANLDCASIGVKTVITAQTFEAGTTYWIGVQTSSTQTLSGIIIASLTPIYLITNVMSTSLFITPAFGSAPTPFGSGTAQNLTVPLVGITL